MPAVHAKLQALRRAATLRPGDDGLVGDLKGLEQHRQELLEHIEKTRWSLLDGGTGIELVDHRLPLALLPVRLETRYDGATLRVRIYPDTIHLDAHEPVPSAAEIDACQTWRKALAATEPRAREAWESLVAAVGARRAIYLAELDDAQSLGPRPTGWASTAHARALPDRFVACVWLTEPAPLRVSSPNLVVPASRLVREPLAVSPDPFDSDAKAGPMGAQAAWLTDFTAALEAGMAIEVPLGGSDVVVHRLIVLGVDAGRDAAVGAAHFSELLRAHESTDGLDICPPGAPTNALPGERTLYLGEPPAPVLFDALFGGSAAAGRRGPPAFDRIQTGRPNDCASFRLSAALGLPPEVLGYTAHAAVQRHAGPMMYVRTLLARLIEPGLAEALGPGINADDLRWVLDDFSCNLHGEALPVLMVGDQPYGVLPVGAQHGNALPALDVALNVLRDQVYAPALDRVPRVGSATTGSAMQVLLDILRSDARPRQWWLRLSPTLALVQAAQPGFTADAASAGNRDAAAALLEDMGLDDAAKAPLLDRLHLDEAALSALPEVLDRAPDADPPAVYLGWLHEDMDVFQILEDKYRDMKSGTTRPPPRTLLFLLCRHAVLAAAHADAMDLIRADLDPNRAAIRQAATDHPEYFEPDGFTNDTYWNEAKARMFATRQGAGTGPKPFALVVDAATAPRSFEIQNLLGRLRACTVADLERELGDAAAMFSHRLDAWFSRAAGERLAEVRGDGSAGPFMPRLQAAAGLSLGAWGVVGRIDRRRSGSAGSYVLAPGPAHAATAGVLMSADHADWSARRGSAFAVDLSSRRVRQAQRLLEGLASGQPLGALLGYGIERALVEQGGSAPAMIAALRALTPIEANRLTPDTAAADVVSANSVVDGLALLRLSTPAGASGPDVATLPRSFVATDAAALQAALAAAADAVAAVSDVLLTESVHQLVRGNPARSAAATNAMSGQPVLPDELDVLRTPLRGDSVGHRVLWLFDASALDAAWAGTPRSRADAAADAWATKLLPAPRDIWLTLTDGVKSWPASLAALLQSAQRRKRGDLALAALDVVLLADQPLVAAPALLEERLLLLAEFHHRSKGAIAPQTPPDALRLDAMRPARWNSSRIGVEELRALAAPLRAVLLGCRALAPGDLPVAAALDTQDQAMRLADARQAAEALVASLRRHPADLSVMAQARHWLAAPDPVGPAASDRATRLAAELEARLATSAAATTWQDAMKALLGATQPALPSLTVDAAALATSFGAPLGATEGDLRRFVRQAGTVRSRMTLLDDSLLACDLLGIAAPPCYALRIAQQPAAVGETWVGLAGNVARGRTGYLTVCAAGNPLLAGGRVCGLAVDDWTEVVPAAEVDAAVALRTDAPSTAAPNAILLCNPPPREQWALDDLLLAVQEALHQAQMRMVDPDLLGTAGQLLPALVLRDQLMSGSLLNRLATGNP